MIHQREKTGSPLARFALAALILAVGTTLPGCGGSENGTSATGQSGSSASVAAANTQSAGPLRSVADQQLPLALTGTVTYQRIMALATITPASTGTGTASLDFANPVTNPCRYVIVQAIDDRDAILAQTNTDGSGNYTLAVPAGNGPVRVRVRAETVLSVPVSARILVQDNTSGGAAYATVSASLDRTQGPQTVNVAMASGYSGTGVSAAVRPSGPFAALDAILTGYQFFMNGGLDPTALPETVVNWSVKNTPSGGDRTLGQIGTSFFDGNVNQMFVLGDASADTDEYDWHVMIHEFGHWMQFNNFRDDSPGGSHSFGDIKDPRVVMSEGYGNSLGALALADPVYKDTNAAGGFSVNFEQYLSSDPNPGWFSELSWTDLVYHLFSATSTQYSGHVGLTPANYFAALNYQKGAVTPTTPFSFLAGLTANGVSADTLTPSLASVTNDPSHFGWNSVDLFGAGENHDGGITAPSYPSSLPVYVDVSTLTNSANATSFNLTVPAQPDIAQPGSDDGSPGSGTAGEAQSTNWLQGNRFYSFTGNGQPITITVKNSKSAVGHMAMKISGNGQFIDEQQPARSHTDVTSTFNTTSGTVYVVIFTNRAATTSPTALNSKMSTTEIDFSH